MGRGHIRTRNTHGKETTQGGYYMVKGLHRGNYTGKERYRREDDMGEGTTRGGDYTERGD